MLRVRRLSGDKLSIPGPHSENSLAHQPKEAFQHFDTVPESTQPHSFDASTSTESLQRKEWTGFGEKVSSLKLPTSYTAMCEPNKLRNLYKCMGAKCAFTTSAIEMFIAHIEHHIHFYEIYTNQDPHNKTWQLCSYCLNRFTKSTELATHLRKQHAECTLQCAKCFYRSKSLSNVHFHHMVEHPETDFVVLQCEQIEQNLPPFVENPLTDFVLALQCSKGGCNLFTHMLGTFCNHLISAHQNDLCCHICCAPFTCYVTMLEHYRKSHGIGMYQCLYCIFGTDSEYEIRLHLCYKHPNNIPKAIHRTEGGFKSYSRAHNRESLRRIVFHNDEAKLLKYVVPVPECESTLDVRPLQAPHEKNLSSSQHFRPQSHDTPNILRKGNLQSVKRPHPEDSSNHKKIFLSSGALSAKSLKVVLVPVTSVFPGESFITPSRNVLSMSSVAARNVTSSTKLTQISSGIPEYSPTNIHASDRFEMPVVMSSSSPIALTTTEIVVTIPPAAPTTSTVYTTISSPSPSPTHTDQSNSPHLEVTSDTYDSTEEFCSQDGYDENYFKCGNRGCRFEAGTSKALKNHLVVCDKARQSQSLECAYCQQLFKRATSLLDHLHTHGPPRFSCTLCAFKAPLQSRVDLHMTSIHHVSSDILMPDKDLFLVCTKVTEVKKPVQMPIPPLWKRDAKKIKLIHGIKLDEKGDAPAPVATCVDRDVSELDILELKFGAFGRPSGSGEFVCPRCSTFKVRARQEMREHLFMDLKYKPLTCLVCEMSSTRKTEMSKHINKSHGIEWDLVNSYIEVNRNKDVENWVDKVLSTQAELMKASSSVSESVSPQFLSRKRRRSSPEVGFSGQGQKVVDLEPPVPVITISPDSSLTNELDTASISPKDKVRSTEAELMKASSSVSESVSPKFLSRKRRRSSPKVGFSGQGQKVVDLEPPVPVITICPDSSLTNELDTASISPKDKVPSTEAKLMKASSLVSESVSPKFLSRKRRRSSPKVGFSGQGQKVVDLEPPVPVIMISPDRSLTNELDTASISPKDKVLSTQAELMKASSSVSESVSPKFLSRKRRRSSPKVGFSGQGQKVVDLEPPVPVITICPDSSLTNELDTASISPKDKVPSTEAKLMKASSLVSESVSPKFLSRKRRRSSPKVGFSGQGQKVVDLEPPVPVIMISPDRSLTNELDTASISPKDKVLSTQAELMKASSSVSESVSPKFLSRKRRRSSPKVGFSGQGQKVVDLEPPVPVITISPDSSLTNELDTASISPKDTEALFADEEDRPSGAGIETSYKRDNKKRDKCPSRHRYSCYYCKKTTKYRHSIIMHSKKNHPNMRPQIVNLTRSSQMTDAFNCMYCNCTAIDTINLKLHWAQAHRATNLDFLFRKSVIHYDWEYECYYCKKRTLYENLEEHCKQAHPQERFLVISITVPKYKCSECKLVFNSVDNLKRHFSMDHPSKQFCYIVLNTQRPTFPADQSLTPSDNPVETFKQTKSERGFKCFNCYYTSSSYWRMIKHMKRHFFTYACTECDSIYLSPFGIRSHKIKKHPESQVKPLLVKDSIKDIENAKRNIIVISESGIKRQITEEELAEAEREEDTSDHNLDLREEEEPLEEEKGDSVVVKETARKSTGSPRKYPVETLAKPRDPQQQQRLPSKYKRALSKIRRKKLNLSNTYVTVSSQGKNIKLSVDTLTKLVNFDVQLLLDDKQIGPKTFSHPVFLDHDYC